MGKRHKWADVIIAWSEGAEIEYRYLDRETYDDEWDIYDYDDCPNWNDALLEYRIKPQPKEPQFLYITINPQNGNYMFSSTPDDGPWYIGKIKLEDEC